MDNKKLIENYRDLDVYRAAFAWQQALFTASKSFPRDEMFSLTDQIRRSSRSIGSNIAEGWAKRRYPAHFVSKLSDADGELQETFHWLRTAFCCEYLTESDSTSLAEQGYELGRLLGATIASYKSFCIHQPQR
jgi:four helix bundle protein